MGELTKFRASLLRSARLISDEINQLLLPFQLNMSYWQALFVIEMKDGCTALEIAEYLNISKPAVSKRINPLLELDLITCTSTVDKRQKKLILTAQGRDIFMQCSVAIDHFEATLLEGFSAHEIAITKNVLDRVIEKMILKKQGDHHERN